MKIFNVLMLSILFCLSGCSFITQHKAESLNVTRLYCDGAGNPVSDRSGPRFGWSMEAKGINRKQSAYQVLVASETGLLTNEKADIWNSGKINSDQSQWVKYKGAPLTPGKRYHWSVKVWDEKGIPSGYSKPAWFYVPVKSDFWKAGWISDSVETGRQDPGTSRAPLFRKSFFLDDLPGTAVLRYSGAGYIDMSANGQPVSDAVLQPSFTRYDKRMEYSTTDILPLLRKGENVLACMPGNGFYNVDTRSAWKFNRAPWRDRPAVICQLEMTWPDGRKLEIISDSTWRTSPGPVVFNQIRNGETYDARIEQTGWNKPGFNDSEWGKASTVDGPSGTLSPRIIPPMRRIGYLSAAKITEPAPGVYLFDFGQNLAGWTKLAFSGKKGQEIVIRHGERLDSTGRLDQAELSRFVFTGETQTSRYISNGDREDTWEPRFVYYGFRYAEVTGLTGKPGEETLKACIVHTDFEPAGDLHTSNSAINQLHENTLWSYLGNFHSIPEDCPHREKMGWTGDGQLAAGTGMLNFYAYNGYRKWMNDFSDEQQENGNLPGIIPTSGWGYEYGKDPGKRACGYGPQWEGACITIPWKLYLNYGDTSVLSDYYPMMSRYMDWLNSISEGHLLDIGIDDHKSLVKSDPGIISSAYYYLLSGIMTRVASITGKQADEQTYNTLASQIAEAYTKKYLQPADHDTVSFLAIALATGFDMLTPESDSIFMKELVNRIHQQNDHVYTGVVGTNAVFSALVRKGYPGVFLNVVTNPEYPSYGNWIRKGATTLWQNWDGSQSRNHIMFGFVDEYMYDLFMGLSNDGNNAGYKRFVLKPVFPADMNDAYTKHTTLYGEIFSGWKKEGDTIEWEVTIPVNTIATLVFPAKADDIRVIEPGNTALELSRNEKDRNMKLGSGRYVFRFRL